MFLLRHSDVNKLLMYSERVRARSKNIQVEQVESDEVYTVQ